MTSIAWRLRRLQAMSVPEIAYRGFQWATQEWEHLSLRAHRAPRPKAPISAKLMLFPRDGNWLEQWQSIYRIDEESLERLLRGKIDLFGNSLLDTGEPTDWHRDPTNGITAPLVFGKRLDYRNPAIVGNAKIIWELGRHQHLIPLAVAYAVTGEPRYKTGVVRAIESWIETNPYGIGIHWTSALEAALRLIAWALIHSLLALRDGPQALFDAVTSRSKLGSAIFQQAKFIAGYFSRHSSANNHLIGELVGLWVATQVFDLGPEGTRWGQFSRTALEQQAKSQVYQDGVGKEQAFYYHLWVLEYLLLAWLVGSRAGTPFSAPFKDRIQLMAGFLRDVAPRYGRPPSVGDSDDGFVTRFEPTWPRDPYGDLLSAVAHIFAFSWDGAVGKTTPQKAFWYRLMAGEALPEKCCNGAADVRQYPMLYREGGYAMLGAGNLHLLFDAGSLGYLSIAAHGHADALSFCLAVDNSWWLVDPGTYAYHDEQIWRDYFRSSRAHNTLASNQGDQSESGGPFLWLRHAKARITEFGIDDQGRQWVAGSQTGYHRLGLDHRRRVMLDTHAAALEIKDFVESDREHEVEIFFHFDPSIDIAFSRTEGCWIAQKDGSPRKLLFDVDSSCRWSVVKGQCAPPLGWFSPSLGVKVPSCTLVGRCDVKGKTTITTRIALLQSEMQAARCSVRTPTCC